MPCFSSMCIESAQSRLTLCDSIDCSPPGSSVHGIFHVGIHWSGLLFPPPEDLPHPGTELAFLVSPEYQADSLL